MPAPPPRRASASAADRGAARPAVSCPHAGPCGACALLDLAPDAQLARKREVVAGELAAYPRLEGMRILSCLPSPKPAGYRNRAKLAFDGGEDGRALLGYYQEGTRRLVDAPACRVLVPEVLETAGSLRELFSGGAHAGLPLRFVDLRCGTDPAAQHLTLVLGASREPPIDAIRGACPRLTGISVNVNPGTGPRVLKGAVRLAWGERHVVVETPGARLRVSAGAFCQVNLGLLPPIHERLGTFLRGARTLADLYAGVGTHGLALHADFDRVLLVEGASASARDARTTLAAEGIRNARLVAAPVERALRAVAEAGADAVVLNPSREGVRPSVLDALAASRASRLAYLSCEPRTLARDLDRLVAGGFAAASVEPIDMMPQTNAVEVLALLSR